MCAGLPYRGVTASDSRWSVGRKVQRIMRSSQAVYMWQGDIRKFYDNIHNVLVMKRLEHIISDKVPWLVYILYTRLHTFPVGSRPEFTKRLGF